jgi:hypothetical protein
MPSESKARRAENKLQGSSGSQGGRNKEQAKRRRVGVRTDILSFVPRKSELEAAVR